MRSLCLQFLLLIWLSLVGCQEVTHLLAEPTPTAAPPTATPEPTATPLPDPYSAPGFAYFLAELEGMRERDRPPLVNRYMAQLPAAPITDGDQAIFLWQGAADQVAVFGDMNGWNRTAPLALTRIPGTELWYLQQSYAAEARLSYQYLLNGTRELLDPLNERTVWHELLPRSELVMPAYTPPPEALPPTEPVPEGTITTHVVDSAALGEQRTVFVYQPAGQLVGARYPSVYILDGNDYMDLVEAPRRLDRLVAAGDIPPLVAVFVPPIHQEQEYRRDDAFVRFLADELVPFIQTGYSTDPDPMRTATLGSSWGGLMAVYAAFARPETFGLAAGHSGLYGLDSDALIRQMQLADPVPVRLHLVVGQFETAVDVSPGQQTERLDVLEANRRLVEVLMRRGYRHHYEEVAQGHSWGLWGDVFGDGLRYLFAQP